MWIHSGNGPHEEMDRRAIACFDQAMHDFGVEPLLCTASARAVALTRQVQGFQSEGGPTP